MLTGRVKAGDIYWEPIAHHQGTYRLKIWQPSFESPKNSFYPREKGINGRSVDELKEKAYVLPALSYALPAFVTVKDGKVQSIKNAMGIEGIKGIHLIRYHYSISALTYKPMSPIFVLSSLIVEEHPQYSLKIFNWGCIRLNNKISKASFF